MVICFNNKVTCFDGEIFLVVKDPKADVLKIFKCSSITILCCNKAISFHD